MKTSPILGHLPNSFSTCSKRLQRNQILRIDHSVDNTTVTVGIVCSIRSCHYLLKPITCVVNLHYGYYLVEGYCCNFLLVVASSADWFFAADDEVVAVADDDDYLHDGLIYLYLCVVGGLIFGLKWRRGKIHHHSNRLSYLSVVTKPIQTRILRLLPYALAIFT